jgi:VanZ family protein
MSSSAELHAATRNGRWYACAMQLKYTRQGWCQIGWIGVAALFYLSLIPMPHQMEELPVWSDKIYHGFAYGWLMWWLSRGYARAYWLRIAVMLVCVGITIELLQSLTPYRTASVFDELANIMGVCLGYLVTSFTPAGFPAFREAQ